MAIVGLGFTETTTFTGFPKHPFKVGVIMYVTIPAEVPVAVKFCTMKAPLPDVAPVTPDCEAIHVNVVPARLADKVMALASPEQMVWLVGVAVTIGLGFTVMTMFTGSPVHPSVVGVTV